MFKILLTSIVMVSVLFLRPDTAAAEEDFEDGVDPNHTDVREAIQAYVDEELSDSFASMYIDRDERELGVLVFQFTEMPDDSHIDAMHALTDDDAVLDIREVDMTEQELQSIQSDIDADGFSRDGFSITHTATMIQNGTVEVGINPYTDEHADALYDQYDADTITIVEGQEATVDSGEPDVDEHAVQEERHDLFQRILDWFRNLF
ncbi:hypothetical protein [Salisediminibacterium selenitireducens]|uniref:Bypass of forespore C C-terminal domain-containing protein n=1 Tax=Bacillus selenitireducens (strain ATCC 700615 / DSM 15326 / MLS10) TaxID=439292 RepID=D6XXP1_BACIE|nr:hypothetical protein [Salisediminibacterium selenitireducens]ADI00084.1 hypothetical protein Bsel_2584 [[Bacillus] selenitireducens MLS10]